MPAQGTTPGDAAEGPARTGGARTVRREALIAAGERIVAAHGLSGLTAWRLAEEANVSLGASYHLFRDLEALATSINARTFERLGTVLKGVPRRGAAEADLIALADAYLDFVAAHPRFWGAVFELPIRDGEANPNAARVDALLAILDDALLSGLPGDPVRARASARILWGAVHGMVPPQATNRMGTLCIDDLDGAVRHLVRCHLAGLAATEGGP